MRIFYIFDIVIKCVDIINSLLENNNSFFTLLKVILRKIIQHVSQDNLIVGRVVLLNFPCVVLNVNKAL